MMDRTGDMQLMKSSVLRAQADSLAAAIFPRLAYVEGQANVNDIPERGDRRPDPHALGGRRARPS
jgi:hypothetical protein